VRPRRWLAFVDCLHLAPLPDLARQREGRERLLEIARSLECNPQTVRNAIHKFKRKARSYAAKGFEAPTHLSRAFDEKRVEILPGMLKQSPRSLFGKDSSLWTLDLAAKVCFEEGLAEERVCGETV